MEFPFEQHKEGNKIIRVFKPDVATEELKWHQDLTDREVIVVKDGGWQFQIEDSVPNKMYAGQKLIIPKFVWHRVIKGNEDLIVEIEELE